MPVHNEGPTKKPKSPLKVGDKVCVVYEPYWDCPFHWVDEMTEFCGQEVTISDVKWLPDRQQYLYRVAESRIILAWCQNCFMPAEADIQEADADMALLLS